MRAPALGSLVFVDPIRISVVLRVIQEQGTSLSRRGLAPAECLEYF